MNEWTYNGWTIKPNSPWLEMYCATMQLTGLDIDLAIDAADATGAKRPKEFHLAADVVLRLRQRSRHWDIVRRVAHTRSWTVVRGSNHYHKGDDDGEESYYT
ncbi:MAG TPA: hypothetical protein VF077_01075 [Nitrospiraceae bacterium]